MIFVPLVFASLDPSYDSFFPLEHETPFFIYWLEDRWEVLLMPQWFQNQIKRAFYEKNLYKIKLLNQCWFFYKNNTVLINHTSQNRNN